MKKIITSVLLALGLCFGAPAGDMRANLRSCRISPSREMRRQGKNAYHDESHEDCAMKKKDYGFREKV